MFFKVLGLGLTAAGRGVEWESAEGIEGLGFGVQGFGV